MRRVVLLLLLLPLLLPAARGEPAQEALLGEMGFERMETVARETADMDARAVVRALLSGDRQLDAETFRTWLSRLGAAFKARFLRLAARLAPIALAGMALRILLGSRAHAMRAADLVCRVAGASLFMETFVAARAAAAGLMAQAARMAETLAPVLVSAVALSGGATTAAILSPMAALCASVIEGLLDGAGLALCGAAASVALAGNLSERFRLNRLFALLKSVVGWLVGLSMTVFMGILSAQGLLGAARDSAATRTARYAVESVVPIIGGEVSDTMGSVAASAAAVKGAVGVTGMLLVLRACLAPLLELAAAMLSLKLVAALLEPAADRLLADAAEQFGEALSMLLALCVGGVVLVLMLLGACLAAAGGIGR